MKARFAAVFVPLATGGLLMALTALSVRNYDWNTSALLHMDTAFGTAHAVPSGLVLYEDAGYDGMLYYQVARDLPALFSGEKTSLDSPYRFQRILLPLVAYVISLGNDRFFSHAFLLINMASALGALALMITLTRGKYLHALTVAVNPAVLIGVLFSLTEPLSLFFIVLFFWLWERSGRRMNAMTAGTLLLSLLARETTVFLIGLLFVWYAWRKQWRDALWTVVPIGPLILWQYFLMLRFGGIGFQANGNIVSFPFHGPITLMLWSIENVSVYRLSALGFLSFVLPMSCVVGREWIIKKRSMDAFCFLLGGLCAVMLTMDAHMWGVITSIGRVVTPVYPVYALYAAMRDTRIERALSILLMMISIIAAFGIALVRHPFTVS